MSALIKTTEGSFPAGSIPSIGVAPSSKEKLPSDVATLVQLYAALSQSEEVQDEVANIQAADSLEDLMSHDDTSLMQMAMSKLAGVLTGLEETMLKYEASTAQMQSEVGQALISNAQKQLQEAKQQYQDFLAAQAKQQKEGLVQKIFGILLTIFSVVASVFMGPEMLIMTAALVTLQYSGGLNAMTSAIANGLAHCMPPAAAKVLADVISTLVIVVVATCVGSVGTASTAINSAKTAAQTATRAGEEGASAAEDAGSAAADTATATTSSATQEATESTYSMVNNTLLKMSKSIQKGIEKTFEMIEKVLPRLSSNGASFAKIYGMTGVTQTNLVNDIAKAAGANDQVSEILNLVIGVIGAIFTAKLAYADTTTVGWGRLGKMGSTLEDNLATNVSKSLPREYQELLGPAQIKTIARCMAMGAELSPMIGQMATGAAQCSTNNHLADLEENLATTEGTLARLETLEKFSSTTNQQMQTAISDCISDISSQVYSVTASFIKPIAAEVSVLQD